MPVDSIYVRYKNKEPVSFATLNKKLLLERSPS